RVLLAWTRSPEGAADRSWRSLVTLPARWSAPRFPLKAADFMARGVAKGPRLGATLAAAEAAWVAAGFPSEPATRAAVADGAGAQSGRAPPRPLPFPKLAGAPPPRPNKGLI